jgi:hypothetical protein
MDLHRSTGAPARRLSAHPGWPSFPSSSAGASSSAGGHAGTTPGRMYEGETGADLDLALFPAPRRPDSSLKVPGTIEILRDSSEQGSTPRVEPAGAGLSACG